MARFGQSAGGDGERVEQSGPPRVALGGFETVSRTPSFLSQAKRLDRAQDRCRTRRTCRAMPCQPSQSAARQRRRGEQWRQCDARAPRSRAERCGAPSDIEREWLAAQHSAECRTPCHQQCWRQRAPAPSQVRCAKRGPHTSCPTLPQSPSLLVHIRWSLPWVAHRGAQSVVICGFTSMAKTFEPADNLKLNKEWLKAGSAFARARCTVIFGADPSRNIRRAPSSC